MTPLILTDFDVPDWPPSTAFWDRMQPRFAYGMDAVGAILVLLPVLLGWLLNGPGQVLLMVSGRFVQQELSQSDSRPT